MQWRKFFCLGIFAFFLFGCTATPAVYKKPHLSSYQNTIVQTALSLLGTPYRYGGTTPKGFDCSGFVKYVYNQSVDLKLPRLAKHQSRTGKSISLRHLRPADIVYFKIKGQKSPHVGIFIGNGKFIHAPSSGGKVNIQSLGSKYWSQRYRGARRLI